MVTLKKAKLSVKRSPIHGYGVFAEEDIFPGDIIEQCYVLMFKDADHLSDLHNFAFYVNKKEESGLPLGYGAIYNHSNNPNANYKIDEETAIMIFNARLPIRCGEEITVSYGDNWFSARGVVPIQAFTWFHIRKKLRAYRRLLRMLLVCTVLALALQFLPDLDFSVFDSR